MRSPRRPAGEESPEASRGYRHCGAPGGAGGGAELGEVHGQGCVIEPEATEPGIELAEGAGVGAAGVVAEGGVDQAARGRARPADRAVGRGEHGERIIHDGNRR